MNLTNGPIDLPNGAMLSDYSTVLQIYANTTAPELPSGNSPAEAKLFCNFCANDQMLGQMAVSNNFEMALQALGEQAMMADSVCVCLFLEEHV